MLIKVILQFIKDCRNFLNIIFKFYKIYNFFMFIVYTIFVNPIDSFSSIIVYLSEVDVSEKASENQEDTKEDTEKPKKWKMILLGVASIVVIGVIIYFWNTADPPIVAETVQNGWSSADPSTDPTDILPPAEPVMITIDEMVNNKSFLNFIDISKQQYLNMLKVCKYDLLSQSNKDYLDNALREDYARFLKLESWYRKDIED